MSFEIWSRQVGRAGRVGRCLLLGVASLLLLPACQESRHSVRPVDETPLPSAEQARATVAQFKPTNFQVPPRSIQDVLAALARSGALNTSERAALVKTASEPVPARGTAHQRLLAHYSRMRAAQQLGWSAQELGDARAATRILSQWSASDGNRPLPGLSRAILSGAAWAESFDGDLARSARLFRMAANEREINAGGAVLGNWREISGLALVTAQSGDLDGALELASQVESAAGDSQSYLAPGARGVSGTGGLPVIPDLNNPWVFVYRASIEAAIAEGQGKWADAEAARRDALYVYQRDLHQGGGAFVEGREAEWEDLQQAALARNLTRQGRLLEAEDVIRGGLRRVLQEKGSRSKSAVIFCLRLGDVLLARGRYEEAGSLAEMTERLLADMRTPADSRLSGQSRYLLAASKALRGQWRSAHETYATVSRDFENNPLTFERHLAGDPLALLTSAMADPSPRLLDLIERERSRQADYKGEDGYEALELLGIRGVAARSLGNRAAAMTAFRRAVPALIRIDRQRRAAPGQRLDLGGRLQVIVESYLALLLDSEAPARGSERQQALREGFELASYLQAGTVQSAIARSAARSASTDPELAALIRAEQDANFRLDASYRLLAQAQSAGGSSALLRRLREDTRQLRRSLASLQGELSSAFPDYAERINPGPVSAEEIARRLQAGEALVAFYAAEEATYAWGLDARGQLEFHSAKVGKRALSERIDRIRLAVDGEFETLGDIPNFDVDAAHALYRALLEPLRNTLAENDSLIIVPHGPLGYLPFAVLVSVEPDTPPQDTVLFDGYRSARWLIRDYALSRLPSAATLVVQRAVDGTGSRPGAAPRAFVGFGDPVFDAGSVPAGATLRGRGTGQSIAMRGRVQTRSAASAALEDLPPLPETRTELEQIARTLEADFARDVFLGNRATEDAVTRAELDRYRIVTFATHGLAAGDLDGLAQPALALSSPVVVGGNGDGLLTMEEVLGLELNAEWVVLSACNTAAADGAGAEAVSGLGQAFFYAGARSLLVSNWAVHSAATTELTTQLFASVNTAGSAGRAQALQSAMLRLLDGATFDTEGGLPLFSYAHPVFWAPFTLVGEAGAG